jgi:polar amino acid transport system permease protein
VHGRETAGVSYIFHFGVVWDAWPELLWGTLLTLRLSAMSMAISLVLAIFGALGRSSGPKWLQFLIAAYVEVIRNTPFLVQIFIIFFGLPALGLRLDADDAALLALVLNGSAYTIEIVRAGIEAISHGQVEAAAALGLHRLQAFRLVVLPQALAAVVAPLGSQFILLMLNSSVVSVISAEELTAVSQEIGARTFRSFEVYIVATGIYFVLSMGFTGVFAGLNRLFFTRPGGR